LSQRLCKSVKKKTENVLKIICVLLRISE